MQIDVLMNVNFCLTAYKTAWMYINESSLHHATSFGTKCFVAGAAGTSA